MDTGASRVEPGSCTLAGTRYPIVPPRERTILRCIAEHSAESTVVFLPLGWYARATGFSIPEVLGHLERLHDWGLLEGSPLLGWKLTAQGWQAQSAEK